MRVALDCRMADWSGVGRYSTGLVRALADLPNVDVLQVVAPGKTPPVPDADAVEAAGNPFTPAGARGIARVLRRSEWDLVHCLHFPTPLPAPHPLVVTLYDLGPLLVPGVMPSAARRFVYRMWNARAASLADRIVVPSAFTRDEVARVFPSAEGKMRIVPGAADDFVRGPIGELGDVVRGAYVLAMGNTKRHKDLPTLLRAFARVAPAHPGLELLLAGDDGPEYVRSVLDGDEAAARVRLTGPIGDAQLRALYASAAALVVPSLYEGFGLPVLEAMALRTPVVSSDAASLPEVTGDAALTFPAGDVDALAAQLSALLSDTALRERLVAAGEKQAASFSWRKSAQLTRDVYNELLRKR